MFNNAQPVNKKKKKKGGKMLSLSSLSGCEKEKMMLLLSAAGDEELNFEVCGGEVVVLWNVPEEMESMPLVKQFLGSKNITPKHQHGTIQNTKLFKKLPDLSEVQGEIKTVQWTIKLIEDVWSQYCKGISEGSSEAVDNLYSFIYHYFTHKFGLDSLVENTFADLIYNSQRYYHISTVCEVFCMLVNSEFSDLDLRFFAIARSHLVGASTSEIRAVQASDSHRHNVLRRFVPIRELSYLMKRVLYKHPHAAYVKNRVNGWIDSPDTIQISPRALAKPGHVDCYELLRFLLTIYADNPHDSIPSSAKCPLQSVDVNSVSQVKNKSKITKRRTSDQSSRSESNSRKGFTIPESEVVDIHVLRKKLKQQEQVPTPTPRRGVSTTRRYRKERDDENIVIHDVAVNSQKTRRKSDSQSTVTEEDLYFGRSEEAPKSSKVQKLFHKMAMREVTHKSVSDLTSSSKSTSQQVDDNENHRSSEINKIVRKYTSVDSRRVSRSSSNINTDNTTRRNSYDDVDEEIHTERHQFVRSEREDCTPIDEDLIFGTANVPTATTESWRGIDQMEQIPDKEIVSLNNFDYSNISTEPELQNGNTQRMDPSTTDGYTARKFVASPRYEETEPDRNFEEVASSKDDSQSQQLHDLTNESDCFPHDTSENYPHQSWKQPVTSSHYNSPYVNEQNLTSELLETCDEEIESIQSKQSDDATGQPLVDKKEISRSLSGESQQSSRISNPILNIRKSSPTESEATEQSTDNKQRGRWTSGITNITSALTEDEKSTTTVELQKSPNRSTWRLNDPNGLSPQRSPARWRLSNSSDSPQSRRVENDFPDLAEDKSPRRGGTWRDASRMKVKPNHLTDAIEGSDINNITSSTSSDDNVEINLARLQEEVKHLKKLQARLQGVETDENPYNEERTLNEKSNTSQQCDEEMDSVPAELLGEGGLMLTDKEVETDSDDRQFYSSLTAALQRRKEREHQQLVHDSPPKQVSNFATSYNVEDDFEFHPVCC